MRRKRYVCGLWQDWCALIVCAILAVNCAPEVPATDSDDDSSTTTTTTSSPVAEAGDILVTNGNDTLWAIQSDGTIRGLVHQISTDQGSHMYGVVATATTIYIAVDNPDTILAVDIDSGDVSTFISNANLSGNIRGMAQIGGDTGDFVIVESHSLERFSLTGTRNTSGWPLVNVQTNGHQINPLAAGGFVLCSTGADVVRTYDDNGTQVDSTTTPLAGSSNAYGCVELPDGQIATVWNGATGTEGLAVMSADLSTMNASYNNQSIMTDPRGMCARENGNILITDDDFDHLVEVDSSGNFVQTINPGVVFEPWFCQVVPSS